MIDRYNQTIGMMNEEVDWFFKQIDLMREEYREDFSRMGVFLCNTKRRTDSMKK